MQIAIIGAGNVGGALARAWARAGHQVTVGVRDPHDPKHAALAGVTDVATAVRHAEVVVLAVPWDATPGALRAAGDLTGRIVIDATNPITAGLELSTEPGTSGGEEVARLLPGAAVFKTLNHVSFLVMAAAHGYPQRPAVLVAGDDEQRKPTVLALLADLGFEPADAGPLRAARLLEPMAVLWVDQAVNRGRAWDDAFAYLHRTGASRDVVLQAIDPSYEVVRLLTDGDLVAVHGVDGVAGAAAFDLYRVADGQVAERWSGRTPVRPPNPSGRTLTDGPAQVTRPSATGSTRKVVQDFLDTVVLGADFAAAGRFLSAGYHQHNPDVGDGVAAFAEAMARFAASGITVAYRKVIHLVADGEFALAVSDAVIGTPATVWDLFRVQDGRIAEHWDLVQPEPADDDATRRPGDG